MMKTKIQLLINDYARAMLESESPSVRLVYEKVIADLSALSRSMSDE